MQRPQYVVRSAEVAGSAIKGGVSSAKGFPNLKVSVSRPKLSVPFGAVSLYCLTVLSKFSGLMPLLTLSLSDYLR